MCHLSFLNRSTCQGPAVGAQNFNDMKKVKLDLSRLTVIQKIAKAELIITRMTGNTNYPSPNPDLAALQALVTELKALWEAAETRDRTKIAEMRAKELELDAMLREMRNHVQDVSKGDEVKILSAGFEVANDPEPIGTLPPPQNVVARFGSHDGEIDIRWGGVYGSKVYILQLSANPVDESSWEQISLQSAVRFTVTGLTSGTQYWFRVQAIGAAGASQWSDHAMHRAA